MNLLGSTKDKISKYVDGKNVPHLEITEAILVHCNIFSDYYQQNSMVLYTFVPNKSFAQLLDISSQNFIFSKTFYSKFSYIEVWFNDQNSKLLALEDK